MHLFDIDVPGKIKFQESEVLSPGNAFTSFATRKSVVCFFVFFSGACNFAVESHVNPRGVGIQYKRPYKDVPPTWVAKSASWYMNDPL